MMNGHEHGQEVAVRHGAMPSAGPAVSATQCSATLPGVVPASWTAIPLDRLDGEGWRRLATPEMAVALARAARDMPQADPPADEQTWRACIGGLRLATIPRDESAEEQIGRARMLRSALKDVPSDILKAACAAYVRHHKWFPTPAELMPYVEAARRSNPPLNWQRWRRLAWLAEEAAHLCREAEIAANPVDPAQISALGARLAAAVRADRHG